MSTSMYSTEMVIKMGLEALTEGIRKGHYRTAEDAVNYLSGYYKEELEAAKRQLHGAAYLLEKAGKK